MNGMTGYSYREVYSEDKYLSTEIKSVNHRYLDVSVHLPSFLTPLELNIKELISNAFKRGKIEVSVYVRLKKLPVSVNPNIELAKQYYNSLKEIAVSCGIDDAVKLEHIVKYDDVLVSETVRDYESFWMQIKENLEANIEEVNSMRLKEGESTKANVVSLLNCIESSVKSVKELVPEMEKAVSESFVSKINEMTDNNYDKDRILTEVAVLVSKSCINEEIERLKHHILHFYKIMENKEDVGKKLDFLCQELHREINTLGSKAVMPLISEYVINVKNCIEKIREQIRNIE